MSPIVYDPRCHGPTLCEMVTHGVPHKAHKDLKIIVDLSDRGSIHDGVHTGRREFGRPKMNPSTFTLHNF